MIINGKVQAEEEIVLLMLFRLLIHKGVWIKERQDSKICRCVWVFLFTDQNHDLYLRRT